VSEDIRAVVAEALASAGLLGFTDTTSPARPKWRVSFSFRGELLGEFGYVHLYLPADGERVRVNCSAPAPALDPLPAEQLHQEMERASASRAPGSAGWEEALREAGATGAGVAGWEATISPYMGMQHRMVLAKVSMPLAGMSPGSLALAVRLGLQLARDARDSLAAARESSPERE
jgi:hypothetical protein